MGRKRFMETSLLCIGMLMFGMNGQAQASETSLDWVWEEPGSLFQDGAVEVEPEEVFTVETVQDVRTNYMDSAELTAEQVIYNALIVGAEEINLTSFAMTPDEVKNLYQDMMNRHADLFFVTGGYSRYTNSSTGKVTRIKPGYSMTGDALAEAKEVFNEKMDEIIEQVDVEWSDLEKALFLHDYLALNFEYDMRVYDATQKDNVVYDSYGFLTQKTGVCQAYTLTYNYLLKEFGIESSVAKSTAMNHIWNVIQIDNKWYHVDVTWDDPTSDRMGRACHDNFLRSDTGISDTKHHGWTTNITQIDSKYEGAFWEDMRNPIVYAYGEWYCTTEEGIATCDLDTLTVGEEVYTLETAWSAGGNYVWQDIYTGLGAVGNKVYFNDWDNIYEYNPMDGTVSVLYTPELQSNESIYIIMVSGTTLYYGCSNLETPYGEFTTTGTVDIVIQVDVDFVWEVDNESSEVELKGVDITPDTLKMALGRKVKVYNGDTLVEDDAALGTGYQVYVGDSTEPFTLVVKGDVTGDAKINVLDMEGIQKHVLQISDLEGAYKDAGLLREGAVSLNVVDMEIVQKYLLQLTGW